MIIDMRSKTSQTKKKSKKDNIVFYLIVYSLSFLPVWMVFLVVEKDNPALLSAGFLYSFLSPFMVQWIRKERFTKRENLIVFAVPVFYVLVSFHAWGLLDGTWSIRNAIFPLLMGFYGNGKRSGAAIASLRLT